MRPTRQTFTLLTVIQISALVLFLKPFFSEFYAIAKTSSRRPVSISDAKQVGMAWLMYSQDDNEQMPISKPYYRAEPGRNQVWQTWYGSISPARGAPLMNDTDGLISSYSKSTYMYLPQNNWLLPLEPIQFGLNEALLRNSGELGIAPADTIADPAATLLMGNQSPTELNEFNGIGPLITDLKTTKVADLFSVDGHMTARRDFPITTCNTDPTMQNDTLLMSAERAYHMCFIWNPEP